MRDQENFTVLLIEDNPGDARLIQEMFKEAKKLDFNLVIQETLSEGLEVFLKQKVDIVLLDLTVSDSSGIGTVKVMREKVKDTPIIVLTGREDEEMALKTLKLGVQDYLIKGKINSSLLVRSISYAIERHNFNEELKISEKKIREALYRTKFYEDIFIHNINNIFQGVLSATELCTLHIERSEGRNPIKDIMKIIKEEIKKGTNLVSNVRTLSQLEETFIEIQSIDARNILNESIENLKSMFQNHKINFHVIAPNSRLYVQANYLLKNVFGNILINAVRFNQSSDIEIIIKLSKDSDNRRNLIKIEFIDNGIGIENSRKKKIFSRESKDNAFVGGLGLGLPLANKILESYKGKIWIENRVEGDYTKGSKFVLSLPETVP